jgi:hypothetical protein
LIEGAQQDRYQLGTTMEANDSLMRNAVETVRENIRDTTAQGKNNIWSGLVALIAAYGLTKFNKLIQQQRMLIYMAQFTLCPNECSKLLFGPQMDNSICINQAFNLTGPRADLCKAMREYISCIFAVQVSRGVCILHGSPSKIKMKEK